ncbi:hypothetical protein C7S18_22400 [Ahniella affigens]|uniref:Uncharacterized protein n=1 Tax=Ahniella affigens TaxID=2021234 RepID=A0A2P1PY33_9GAMM|nr:hypothetical protein [Ahniella affigens]AVP99755.1 hypothetical protein C7S18_22400 [Ahniella affigens]
MAESNPYLAPKTTVSDWNDPRSDLVAIREEHVRHEVLLKSIGSLYGLGAVACIFALVATLMTLSSVPEASDGTIFLVLSALIYGGIGLGSAFIAYGFRKLKPWVKIPGTILAGIGLLGIPVGTIVNVYILYLIWCQKGRRVLADDYQGIIAQTPQVKYKRSVGDWIALIIVVGLLLVLIGLIVIGMLSGR